MNLSVNGSDKAADTAYQMLNVMVAFLRKKLPETTNCYNTPGIVNVAMILDEIVFASDCVVLKCHSGMQLLIKDTIEGMKLFRDEAAMLEWDSAQNKAKHLQEYQELIERLSTILESTNFS